jgi:transcriptional regulator with XRE-family HTH domain
MAHWTERSIDDYLYRIATDFVLQLENKIESGSLSNAQLARKMGVSRGRVSQILNNPGNLTLKMIIRCARALGMKIAVVAYDDDDYSNEKGPINAEIFRICWENSGKPTDFWSLPQSQSEATSIAFVVPAFGQQAERQNITIRTFKTPSAGRYDAVRWHCVYTTNVLKDFLSSAASTVPSKEESVNSSESWMFVEAKCLAEVNSATASASSHDCEITH